MTHGLLILRLMGLLHWEGGRNLFKGEGGGREIEKVKEAVVGVSKKKRWGWPGGREGGRREGKGSKRR